MSKLKSRKFWVCIAAILGSVAAAIAGFTTDSEVVAVIGIVCGIISAAIYEIVEAVCDVESIAAKAESEETEG